MISNLDFESENPFQIYSGSSNDFYSLFSDKLSVNLATIQSEGIQDKFFSTKSKCSYHILIEDLNIGCFLSIL